MDCEEFTIKPSTIPGRIEIRKYLQEKDDWVTVKDICKDMNSTERIIRRKLRQMYKFGDVERTRQGSQYGNEYRYRYKERN